MVYENGGVCSDFTYFQDYPFLFPFYQVDTRRLVDFCFYSPRLFIHY
jgi:hypothetical protein